jgi:hypothetical protein
MISLSLVPIWRMGPLTTLFGTGARITILFIVAVSFTNTTGAEDISVSKEDSEQNKQLMGAIGFANGFRYAAATGDLESRVDSLASPQFASKWGTKIRPYFKDQSIHWEDFFSSAIIFVGRFEGTKAVVTFYNPWSDGALILGIDWEKLQIIDGVATTGETIRDEPLDEKSVFPIWQRSQSSLALSLSPVYTRTEKAIDKLFPIDGPFEVIPSDLQKRLGSQELELMPLKIRMMGRVEMFEKLISGAKKSIEGQTREKLGPLALAIKTGSKEAFVQAVSPAQQDRMTDTIFELPPTVLGRMAPNFYLGNADGAVVALVNPEVPQWFLSVHFKIDGKGVVYAESVELYRFDLLNLLASKN